MCVNTVYRHWRGEAVRHYDFTLDSLLTCMYGVTCAFRY